MKTKKNLILGLAAGMGISLLTGCAPGSAKSLVNQYSRKDHDNYLVLGDISVEMVFSNNGVSLDLPFDFTVAFSAAADAISGKLNVQTEMLLDGTVEENMNVYAIKNDDEVIVYQDAYDSWEYSKFSLEAKTDYDLPSLLKNMEWSSFEKTDEGYIIQADLSSADGSLKTGVDNALGYILESLYGEPLEDMTGSMEGGEVTCTFDKNLNLTAMSIQNYSGQTEENDEMPGIQLDFNMNLTFSDFDEIEKIELPEKVSNCEEGEFSLLDLLNF